MTTVTKPKTATASQFDYEGEYLDLPAQEGYELLAEYRAAAKVLHEAKARAKEVEAKIQQRMGGYENARIDGQVVVTWHFVDTTSFDAKGFKESSPANKALYESFLVTKETRRFRVDGTVGVD